MKPNTTNHSIRSVHSFYSSLSRRLRALSAVLLAITPLFASCNMNPSAPTASAPPAQGREFQMNTTTVTEVFGNTPERDLARAAAAGDAQQVVKLIKAGANPNARGKINMTPLFWVMAARNINGTTALLQNGADPNLPMQVNRGLGDVDLYPLIAVSGLHALDMMRVLLENGAKVNVNSGVHNTPLSVAAYCLDCIKLLVKHGADINRPSPSGEFLGERVPPGDLDTYLYLLDQGYRMKLDRLAWRMLDRIDRAPPDMKPKMEQIVARIRAMGIEPFVPEWKKQELEEEQKKKAEGKKP